MHNRAASRPTGEPDKEIVRLEKPGEVLEAAGAWLAAHLETEGFSWSRTERRLQRAAGGRIEKIEFGTTTRNRKGQLIRLEPQYVRVLDEKLLEWRRAHPERVLGTVDEVLVEDRADEVLGYWFRIDLAEPAHRIENLEALLSRVRGVLIPWLAWTRDPESLASEVPDAMLRTVLRDRTPALVEWLISRDQQQSAQALVQRWFALHPSRVPIFESGGQCARDGRIPEWYAEGNDDVARTALALGWTAQRNGIS